MSTPILLCPTDTPDPSVIKRAGTVLRDGGLVAIPTETVYGLGANALDPRAVASIFAAKGRPSTDPLIVHVDDLAMTACVVDGPFPAPANALAEAFWPGPLTLVLPRHASVPAAVSSGLPHVGVRCPSHPTAKAIISAAGVPIAAPSANRFGRVSPTRAAHVAAELGGRIDLIIDSGPCEKGLESTVVSFDGDMALVLRHGAIPLESIAHHVTVRSVDTTTDVARASPGHDERHYSPGTPTTTVIAGFDPSQAPAGPVLYLGYEGEEPVLPEGWRFASLGSRLDLTAIAHSLYDALRAADTGAPVRIIAELTGESGLGRAIDDRLTRAGSSRVAKSVADL